MSAANRYYTIKKTQKEKNIILKLENNRNYNGYYVIVTHIATDDLLFYAVLKY